MQKTRKLLIKIIVGTLGYAVHDACDYYNELIEQELYPTYVPGRSSSTVNDASDTVVL